MQALDALTAALESGSPELILGLLAPDAVLWHNDDRRDLDAAAVMRRVPELHDMLDDIRVEVIRRSPINGGWMQQFVLHGTVRATGAPLAAHRCIVVLAGDDGVTRLEEYVDPTFAEQLGPVH